MDFYKLAEMLRNLGSCEYGESDLGDCLRTLACRIESQLAKDEADEASQREPERNE